MHSLWAKAKIKTITNFQINRNGHRLKSQNSINYLGIVIDQNLSGETPLLKRLILD
jgi:hypothetical protein